MVHQGKYLLVENLTQSKKVDGLNGNGKTMTVVGDQNGIAMNVAFQSLEEESIPIGMKILIKEPYFS